jgi:hypothetical protein
LSRNGGQAIQHYILTLHGHRRLNLSCFLFKFHHGYAFDILVAKMRANDVFNKVNFNFSIVGSSTSQQCNFK